MGQGRPADFRCAQQGLQVGQVVGEPVAVGVCRYPAVANSAVVPKSDVERGAVVKAYVVLAHGVTGDAALVAVLQEHVRGLLAPYEYPKEIEFIDALPMTTTGKVQRRVLRLREEDRARERS